MIKTIIEDKRPIRSLHSDGWSTYIGEGIGLDKVAEIVPYHENGEMAPVVWFAIFNELGVIMERLPARNIHIRY